jgi:uridine kinase
MASNSKIILIDGPAGSGKTTLSKQLQKELNCQVVHLDDHYNGWDEALGPELTHKLQDIVANFLANKISEIPIYNWVTSQFEGSKMIQTGENLIIEGVGAGQSAIRDQASKIYWVEAAPEIALNRVLERDGKVFEARVRAWQIREAKHFRDERTREFADFIISTT